MAGFGSTSAGDILSSLGVLSQLPRDTGNTPNMLIPQILAALGSMGPVAPTSGESTGGLESRPVAPPETALPPPPAFPPGATPLAQPQPAPAPAAPTGMGIPGLPGSIPAVPTPASIDPLAAGQPAGPISTFQFPPPAFDQNPFPGGSVLQNLGINLPGTVSPPPRGAGGGAGPRSPNIPVGQPSPSPAAPMATVPEPAGASGSRGSDGGQGKSRLFDTLAVIGAVLSQPIPPGGNAVSQIGKAMATGFAYNKMLDSANQEQQNVQKTQDLAARRTGVAEAQLGLTGQRVGLEARRVAADERMTDAQITALGERVAGTRLENRFKEIELQFKNDPARRAMELKKLAMEVDNLGARTDLARSQTSTPDDRRAAALVKALKDSGAIDPMNPAGINWQAAAPVYSTYGYKPLNPNEVAQAKAQYQKLIQSGMQPIDAERQINLWLSSPERKRVPISLATPAR